MTHKSKMPFDRETCLVCIRHGLCFYDMSFVEKIYSVIIIREILLTCNMCYQPKTCPVANGHVLKPKSFIYEYGTRPIITKYVFDKKHFVLA